MIVRQRTPPDSPEPDAIWIDTSNACIYERIAGLDAWLKITPADLAHRLGGDFVEVLSVPEIIAAIKEKTASLRVAYGNLEIVGGAVLNDELIAEIRRHEVELIEALPDETQAPRRWHNPRWASWLDGPGYRDDF